MDLTEFLLARISEDEAAAKAAGHLAPSGPDPTYVSLIDPLRTMQQRISPARVLAECDAKRRIVEAYVDMSELGGTERLEQRMTLRWAMELHALAYADHPDYREEWKP